MYVRHAAFDMAKPQPRKPEQTFAACAFLKRRQHIRRELHRPRLFEKIRCLAIGIPAEGLLAGLVQLVYNGGDATLSWFGRLAAESDWRHVMVAGGVAALLAALLVRLAVPDDRGVPPSAGQQRAATPAVRELFVAGRVRLTLTLALLCGLNFFAFQSFNGWLSTFLRETHHLSADAVGRYVTAVHLGSMLGAVVWGVLADRYGRRFNAYAFMAAAVFILLYLWIPAPSALLAAVGFAYGFCFVASGIWGPYFTELYPAHLHATAASIFNWGRVVSFFGALLSGTIADALGLTVAMRVGAVVFLVAAILWRTLPETLHTGGEARA